MMPLKGLVLVVATSALVFAVTGNAAGPGTVSNVYTVGVLEVPGVDTGLVLKNGRSLTVSATGTACPHDSSGCVGPDGDTSVDTTHSAYKGWVLPGAPAYGLVGRVGNGPWVQLGSGPTDLSGSGDLVLAMNDEYGAFADNSGSFTVTVSTRGRANVTCKPGWGYGDANHQHCGPPGLANKPSPGKAGPPGTHGNSDQHGTADPNTNAQPNDDSQSNGNSQANEKSQGNGASNGKGAEHRP